MPILLSFLNDPDKPLRDEGLAFGVKKFKDRDVEILAEALKSRYTDMQLQAVDGLIKKATKPAQSLLVGALNDSESTVRLKALQALIDSDARAELRTRKSRTPTCIVAAVTLAKHGRRSPRPLLAQVRMPKPSEAERVNDWANRRERHWDWGISVIRRASAVAPLLNHDRADLREPRFRRSSAWSSPGATDVAGSQHADPR